MVNVEEWRGRYFPIELECEYAKKAGLSVRELLIQVCEAGVRPERYARNFSLYTVHEQALLLGSTVGVVGMGGLGGITIEMLTRMGVGCIVCADGDTFEASNLNRQLFATECVMHEKKTCAGVNRIRQVSSVTQVESMDAYLTEDTRHFYQNCDVLVDALGGFSYRDVVADIAGELRIPLVTGAIAGKCGYVGVIVPGKKPPIHWNSLEGFVEHGVEKELGNPAQTVCFASAMMQEYTLRAITKGIQESEVCIFDMEKMLVEQVYIE